MATFGIMDAINAITVVYGLAVQLKEEGKEMAAIEREIKKVKKHLAEIQLRMSKPQHPLGMSGNKIKTLMEDDIKTITDGCKAAEPLFKERRRMHSLEFGSKLLFITFRLPVLKDIVDSFYRSTSSLNEKINLLLIDAAGRAAENAKRAEESARRAALKNAQEQKKLDEKFDKVLNRQNSLGLKLGNFFAGQQKGSMEERLDARLEKLAAEQRKLNLAREEHERNTAKLVKLLEKLGPKAIENAALGLGGSQCADKLVDDLVKDGVKRNAAKKSVGATLSAVRNEKRSQISPLKRARTAEAEKGAAASSPPPSEKKTPSQKGTVPKSVVPFPTTSELSILCVDGSNSGMFQIPLNKAHLIIAARSVIAQTYLEFMRVWTMNTQKRWLFKRVDSAGIRIPTPFTRAILESSKYKLNDDDRHHASKLAIDAIAGEKSHFETHNPDEKGTIVNRMYNHRAQGITESQYEEYDWIICMDYTSNELVKKILATNKLKRQPEVYHIKNCEWYSGGKTESKDDMLKLSGLLKLALKAFAKEKLNWSQPAIGIMNGDWRTLQIIVSKDEKSRMFKDSSDLARKVMDKKGCRVLHAPEAGNKFLISISGPQGKLNDALKMIDAAKAAPKKTEPVKVEPAKAKPKKI